MEQVRCVWYVSILCSGMAMCCATQQIDVTTLPTREVSGIVEATERATTRVGEELEIKLSSNPTTGYQWHLTMQQERTVLSAQYKGYTRLIRNLEPEKTTMVGSGGFDTWTFKALKAGTAHLLFEYLRSWEPDSIHQRVNIEVQVTDD